MIRAISSLDSGSPGTIAKSPFLSGLTAESRRSSRRPLARFASSWPWQAKQFLRQDRPHVAVIVDFARRCGLSLSGTYRNLAGSQNQSQRDETARHPQPRWIFSAMTTIDRIHGFGSPGELGAEWAARGSLSRRRGAGSQSRRVCTCVRVVAWCYCLFFRGCAQDRGVDSRISRAIS